VVEKILRHLGAWHDPPAGLSPPGAPGPYPHEPCDDVDPTPDYENVLPRLRSVVFQAGLKAGLCTASASSGSVCPQSRYCSHIAWPRGRCRSSTLSAMGQNRQKCGNNYLLMPSARSGVMGFAMNASAKQFSFTRAALSTGGRAESKFLSARHSSGGIDGARTAKRKTACNQCEQ